MAKIRFGRHEVRLPKSKPIRILLGIVLIFFGFLGFLPIVGFWMIPLGVFVLAIDIPLFQRLAVRIETWFENRKARREAKGAQKK